MSRREPRFTSGRPCKRFHRHLPKTKFTGANHKEQDTIFETDKIVASSHSPHHHHFNKSLKRKRHFPTLLKKEKTVSAFFPPQFVTHVKKMVNFRENGFPALVMKDTQKFGQSMAKKSTLPVVLQNRLL